LEATSEIRALKFPGLIIGLTGNALDDDVEHFLEAGADSVFAKPFTDSQLSTILDLIKTHGFRSSPEIRSAMQIATGRARAKSVVKAHTPAW
jgi:CheY-like chemotaxis protein